MPDDVARAFAFMARGDMAGTHAEETPFGVAVRSTDTPLRQDSNYLLVDSTGAGAPEIADAVQRLELRVAVVKDEATGARLADGFRAIGWQTHHHVVMVQRSPPERSVDTRIATEVDEEALREFRRSGILTEPWGGPELADQIIRAKQLIGERIHARFFAVLVAGEIVAAAELYLDGNEAQVEDVVTVEQHRNRGYASALVVHAVGEARAAGATFVFLVARADDWPRHLYERLGFETVGFYYKFFR
jgi:ribosomal protein S18 acetylase RimI-like enzyme